MASRRIFKLGTLPPNPRDLSHSRRNDGARRQITLPPLIPAVESALELRPRRALSSAQVFPEWITATSPCNDLSANGDYPLDLLSHPRGSVQSPPRAYAHLQRTLARFSPAHRHGDMLDVLCAVDDFSDWRIEERLARQEDDLLSLVKCGAYLLPVPAD